MCAVDEFQLSLDSAIPGLEHLDGSILLTVGVPEGAENDRTGANVAEYATYNEFGTATIPARPAFRQTIDTHLDEYVDDLADVLLSGVAPEMALNQLGEQMAKDVSQSIRDWQTPPNADSTVAQKGENNPLIDTESYAKSIVHRVARDG